ncbi:MAG: hypothetical protein NVSMB9_17010 [Isosphaeraceae bacterium]
MRGNDPGSSSKDLSKPTPSSSNRPENAQDNVAPANQSQSQLVLRQLKDLVQKDEVTPDIMDALGVKSKEELNQFITKFEGAPKSRPGEGREVKVTPEPAQGAPKDQKFTDLNPSTQASTKTMRERGQFVQDTLRGNNEGVRFVPPPEIRAGFDAYRESLARSRSSSPSR